MTLTTEELRTSWIWKHKWQTLLVCLLVWILSGSIGYLAPSLVWPLAFVNIIPVFVLVRLAQLYYAPNGMKNTAKN